MSVEAVVIRAFDALFGADVSSETQLSLIKVDSLDRLSLVQLLEQELEISIPDTSILEFKTVKDVINTVEVCLQKKLSNVAQ